MNPLWVEIALVLFSGLQTLAMGLGFFILKDIRDRVSRLESFQMTKVEK